MENLLIKNLCAQHFPDLFDLKYFDDKSLYIDTYWKKIIVY
jgi:hypothetical protein